MYNFFPCLGPFLKNWRILIKYVEEGKADTRKIIEELKKTLDSDICRCFIDAFLIRKKHLEVRIRTLYQRCKRNKLIPFLHVLPGFWH